MTNRVHIDAPAGVVEIEGEKDFVEGLLAKLFPLLEEAGFGSRPPNAGTGQVAEQPEAAQEAAEAAGDDTGKGKARKRRGSMTPKGHSCAARIVSLKGEGFFKEHRNYGDIVEALKVKGWTHNAGQVGAALSDLFRRQNIQRTKEGNGSWKYFWDRD
ncbi:MAG: hypothetical protein QM681_13825 [Novosphingobium sp.]